MSIARLFMEGGPLMWPLVLIVLVVLGIALRILWHLLVRGASDAAAIQSGLDGLLFWGGFAVVIGVLGSAVGYHKAVSSLVAHGLADPRAVWMGTAEGMLTTLAGLGILTLSGLLWFPLRWRFLAGRGRR